MAVHNLPNAHKVPKRPACTEQAMPNLTVTGPLGRSEQAVFWGPDFGESVLSQCSWKRWNADWPLWTGAVEIKRHEGLWCPPCIRGKISGVQPHEQLVLRCTPQDGLPVTDISAITDQQLVEYLCQNWAVFPCPRSDEDKIFYQLNASFHFVL